MLVRGKPHYHGDNHPTVVGAQTDIPLFSTPLLLSSDFPRVAKRRKKHVEIKLTYV